jgi:hypothetical protein
MTIPTLAGTAFALVAFLVALTAFATAEPAKRERLP